MKVLETGRLTLRRLTTGDAGFIVRLVNGPSWLRYIGDYGVRTTDDAIKYIERGPLAMYARVGFGLYLVELKETGDPIGICGLIKRESLQDADIGFAFLEEYWSKGYAAESASAVLAYGREKLRLGRIVAVSSQENHASERLLHKLGFRFEGLIRLKAGADEVRLFALVPPEDRHGD